MNRMVKRLEKSISAPVALLAMAVSAAGLRETDFAFVFAGVLSEITGNSATAPGSISDEIFTSRRSFSEGENDLAGEAGAGAGAG